jgi:hypothetical protein
MFRVKNYFVARRMPRSKSGKTRRKVDLAAMGEAIKDVGEGVVPWVNFWFSFFCVNRFTCCKV